MHLVVDNTKSPRFKVLQAIEELGGKECMSWFAVRKVEPTSAGYEALEQLVREGIVRERSITVSLPASTIQCKQRLTFYSIVPPLTAPIVIPKELRPLRIV